MMNVRLAVELNAEEEIVHCQNQTTNKINVNRGNLFHQLHPPQIVLKQEYQAEMQEIYAEQKVAEITQEMVLAWADNQGQHLASLRNLCQKLRLVRN